MTHSYNAVASGLPRPADCGTAGKVFITPEEACAQAEGFLLKAGFAFARASRLSEARYFKFPGRHAVLRVATHKKCARNPLMADGPTVSSITFSAKAAGASGLLKVSSGYVEWTTATAIGIYMLRSAPTI